jgi:hypothetical protein
VLVLAILKKRVKAEVHLRLIYMAIMTHKEMEIKIDIKDDDE